MSLPSEDSFSKYFPEAELVELIECADDLPGGLGSRRNNQAPKPPAEQTSSPRGMKRPAPAFEHSQSTSVGLNSRDNDIYAASTYGGFGQYMRNKRAKLQVQNHAIATDADENENKTEIFKGVNGYTKPSIQELRVMILEHGGIFQPYLDNKGLVTHIITTALTSKKAAEWARMRVVKPEWITDSIANGVRLDWRDYLFTHGSTEDNDWDGKQGSFKGKRTQTKLSFKRGEAPASPIPANPVSRDSRSESESPAKGGGFGLEVVNRREVSPHKTDKVKKMDILGQLGVRLFGIENRRSESPVGSDSLFRAGSVHRDTVRTHSPSGPADSGNLSRRPSVDQTSSNKITQKSTASKAGIPTIAPQASTDVDCISKSGPTSIGLVASTSKQNIGTENASPLYTADPATIEQASRVPSYAAYESNPHAAKAMKSEAFRQTRTSVSDNFIEGYYQNSRLHYLSTWKAELRNIVTEAHEKAVRIMGMKKRQPPQQEAKPKSWDVFNKGKKKQPERYYMHCDFDSFFVAVGLLERPEHRGKPVVVCHSQGETGGKSSTSEIASASYEARNFGIRNGMSLGQARKLCPEIVTVPYEFQKYKELSLKFYSLLIALADDIQAVSVDEAIIEVTNVIEDFKSRYLKAHPTMTVTEIASHDFAKQYAEFLRYQIKDLTGCEISIGISYNILMARLATRRAKPAGSFHLTSENVADFLSTISIGQLHGFGHAVRSKAESTYKTANLLKLGQVGKESLIRTFGKKTGETIWNASRGIDNAELQSDTIRKSVSCDINFGIRFETNDQVRKFIYQMATEVSSRLAEITMRGKHITIKIMKRHPDAPVEPPKFLGHGLCETFTKSSTIAGPGGSATSDGEVIAAQAWRLLSSYCFDPRELRGITVQMQKLEPAPKNAEPVAENVVADALVAPVEVIAVDDTPTDLDRMEVDAPPPAEQEDSQSMDVDEEGPPEGVDPSFLEALPPDIRAELEARNKAGRAEEVIPPPLDEKGISAQRMSKIIQQLAPRNIGSNQLSKATPFDRRPLEQEKLKVPHSALEKLGIDPEVFSQLSINDQKEQLSIYRTLQQKPPDTDVFKPRTKIEPVGRLKAGEAAPVLPLPSANHIEEPALVRKGRKGELPTKIVEKSELYAVITTWVDGFEDEPPRKKDVSYFAKFLVRCVDSYFPSETPLIRAVCLLKWWRHSLRQKWPEPNWSMQPRAEAPSEFDPADTGTGWWMAFWEVKGLMDKALRPKYGGMISLK